MHLHINCLLFQSMIQASDRLHRSALDKVMKATMSFFDANPAGRLLNRFSKDLDEGILNFSVLT